MTNGMKKILMALWLISMGASLLSAESFDHQYAAFDRLLKQDLGNSLVNYQAIQKSPELLNQILMQFEGMAESDYKKWQRNKQIAFWINAYNAAVIKTIVDHYPLNKGVSWKALAYPANSIQQIPDVWDRMAIKLLGKDRSLNEIEHEILRREFKDPRIHFALVCASIGCPTLRSEPYSPAKLDSQLNDQIGSFLSDRQKAYYDQKSNTLHLSPIFKWFGKDFDQSGGVIDFVKKYWPGPGSEFSVKTKIKWLDYDWNLNEKTDEHDL